MLRYSASSEKKTSSFKHAAWSKDSILCFWRNTIFCAIFSTLKAAPARCAVNVLTSLISFLFSWPWWMRCVVKHNMLKISCKILVFPEHATWPTVCTHTRNLATCYFVLAPIFATAKNRYWLLGMIAFVTNPLALERVLFSLETKHIKNKIGTRCSDLKHAVIFTVTLILDFFSTSSRLRPSVRTWTAFFVAEYIISP